MRIRISIYFHTLLLSSVLVISCAAPNPKLAAECERLLTIAEKEMDAVNSKGFSGGVSLTKAGALISAARIQQQFNKYPNCIDKAKRASTYIKMSAGQN